MSDHTHTEVTITFSAAAGLGLQTAEDLARSFLSEAGYYVFSSREYMSRVRGGNNSTQFRISTKPVRALAEHIDWLFALSPGLHSNITENISSRTKILGDADVIGEEISKMGFELIDLALANKAAELGGAYYSSMIVAGVIAGLFMLSDETADTFILQKFAAKGTETVENNKRAFRIGHQFGADIVGKNAVLPLPQQKNASEIFLDGDTTLALGAASAGCNYVTTYPMSPGTGLFTFFAKHARELGAVVEQAEDEISVINMAVGAAYAGARAITTTSDGGFVLMSEGISLAGITETPVVIHLAQRPGPATGLATRTEQAGIEIALHAGHGEFPKALFSPINVESCFKCAGAAVHTAQKFQTPVIILTDQYLLDTGYDIERPDPAAIPEPLQPVKAEKGYKRYAFTNDGNGISPFAVPGYGDEFVNFDSHEHTEDAHITEDRALRTRMNDKRLGKLVPMRKESLPPITLGNPDAEIMLVCWGSVFEPLREAFEALGRKNILLVGCEQVYPLAEDFVKLMRSDAKKIFVEGNATGQFARLVRAETGVGCDAKILKYNGFQYSAEELRVRVEKTLKDLGL